MRKIIEKPYIVVACQPDDGYSTVCEFCKLAEKSHESFWHDISVFVPIVENVAKQIYGVGVGGRMIKKIHNSLFHLALRWKITCAKMEVADEIDLFPAGQGP